MNEESIQQSIIIWYNNNYSLKSHNPRGLIFSVPNDTKNYMELKRKKNTGLLSGVSDLIVILPNSKILFIEVKSVANKQQPDQIEFQERVEKLNYKYYVIYSLTQFQQIIWQNLPNRPKDKRLQQAFGNR